MRLTLRTLLAYMDGLLDPKDSQEIGKKIEDSKFATELFHKIRDVMRRLRLAAPSITERGANLDCNTVAEYLDNALPGDRVPDFEEVSLKSEMHLAEVASCHQILTMVLGEPAEIDPESRQRMYQLPTVANRDDEERLAAVEAASMLSGDGNAVVPPAPAVKVRPRPVVPEYLREPRKTSRLLPAAAAMLLVGAAIGLILLMLHQFDPGTPLGNFVQRVLHGNSADNLAREDSDGTKLANTLEKSDTGHNGDAATKSSGSAPVASTNEPVAPSVGQDTGNALAAAGKSEVPEKRPVGVPGKAPEATTAASPAPGGPSLPPVSVPATPPASETKPGVAEKPLVRSVAGPNSKPAEPKTLPDGPTVGTPSVKPPVEIAKVDTSPQPNPGITAENKAKIGRFLSDGQDVLLKFEANHAEWRRVLPEEFLAGRQPLLALPSYRPRVVVLNVGAALELINGTRIELLPDDAQGQPGVDIDFGRLVIKPLAQAGARLRVVVGSHRGTITLTSVESVAGLEVTRVHDPGTDPEKVLSHALTKLYVAHGGAVWEEGEGKQPVRLTAPAELLVDRGASDTPDAEKDVPKWITVNTVNELDQRAAQTVSQALPADHAGRGLMELTEARQKEIRWLAARCLGYLGQFDPMTAALNDIDFRREWPDYIDQLKEAIARGPETAAAIRQSLERQYGNESAALLYRMLWGYTDKELEDGEDARLVKYLDHEVPAFRVLAAWNLQDITHKGLYYKPEATAAKCLPQVQQWRRQLEMGRIRFNVPEVKPRSAPAEPPSKQSIPKPPKPLEGSLPAEVRPTSASEPIVPGPVAADDPSTVEPGPGRVRPPVSVPEPEPPERRPEIAFPEPSAANGQ